MKAVVAAFNQEKALVGAFSVITNLRMELFGALIHNNLSVGVFAANCDNFLLLVAVTSGGTGRLAAGMLVWLGRRVNAFHPSWFISRRRYQPSERPTIIESSKNAAVITTRQYNTILAHYTLDIQQF